MGMRDPEDPPMTKEEKEALEKALKERLEREGK
jgi:hypothetical protein